MHLDDIVDQPAEEGARRVTLELLRRCDRASQRLVRGDDPDALHDFRVAVRRLRTALRSFRPLLAGSVRRRDERRLRQLAKRSNAARDAEVHLAFLSRHRPRCGARGEAGLAFLEERLRAQREEGPSATDLAARFAKVSRRLARRLPRYEVRLDAAPSTVAFAAALAEALRDELDAVRSRVAAVAGPGDEERVHRARIATKRLRYLLEPLRGNAHADAAVAVRALKRLQELLGELHDVHVLAHELQRALVDAAVERARRLHAATYDPGGDGVRGGLREALRGGPRHGLLATTRRLRERRDLLFGELERGWRSGRLDLLAAEVVGVVIALERRAGGRSEVARSYLLSAVPERAASLPVVETSIGWLPGSRIRERVVRVAEPGGARYRREIFQGEGLHRLRIEDEIARELFEALWALTEGRRESRRRREVSEEGATWWIDEIVDRDLVVAEARLPLHAGDAPMPAWLRRFVLREAPPPAAAPGADGADAEPAEGASDDGDAPSAAPPHA